MHTCIPYIPLNNYKVLFCFCILKPCDDVESHKTWVCGTDIFGKNYLTWILDVESHLDAINFEKNIKEGNQASM